MHALPEGANAAARQFGVHDSFVAEVAAAAAVFGGHVRQQQAGVAGLQPGLAVHVVLLAPAGIVGEHFCFDETHDRVAKHFEVIVHPGNDVWVHGRSLLVR